MTAEQHIPREITHPVTGARMVLVEDQTSRAKEAKLTGDDVGNPEAGRRVFDAIRRKEQEHGYLYRDPATGYLHRFKPSGATSTVTADGTSTVTRHDAGAPATAADREAKRRELQQQLEALGTD